MKNNSAFFLFAFMSKKKGKHFAPAQKAKREAPREHLFFSENIMGDVFGEDINGEFNPIVRCETL